MLVALLIRLNFCQIAMHGENSLKIIAKPDGQAKEAAQAYRLPNSFH
jgi:hypothetical protein